MTHPEKGRELVSRCVMHNLIMSLLYLLQLKKLKLRGVLGKTPTSPAPNWCCFVVLYHFPFVSPNLCCQLLAQSQVWSWARVPWLPSVPMRQHEPMVLTQWCRDEGHSLYFHSLVITGHLFTFPWIFTPFRLVGLYNEPLATLLPSLLNAVSFLLTCRQGGNSNNS